MIQPLTLRCQAKAGPIKTGQSVENRRKECHRFWLRLRIYSNFERSNISLKEDKQDGVDLNSNGLDYWVQKNEGKILCFSAD